MHEGSRISAQSGCWAGFLRLQRYPVEMGIALGRLNETELSQPSADVSCTANSIHVLPNLSWPTDSGQAPASALTSNSEMHGKYGPRQSDAKIV